MDLVVCFLCSPWKTDVMVSEGITKDGLSNNKVDPCGVCSLKVHTNSVMCVQCGEWMHGSCAALRGVDERGWSYLEKEIRHYGGMSN